MLSKLFSAVTAITNLSPEVPTSYLVMQNWGTSSTCEASAAHSPLQAILANSCSQINSTFSVSIVCQSPAHCTENLHTTADCSGDPSTTVDVITDGKCNVITDGPQSAYGVFTQTDAAGATAGMGSPYLGMWDSSTCTGPAWQFMDSSACNPYAANSYAQRCSDGVPQSCSWSNSTTCAGKSTRCSPMAGYQNCQPVPAPPGGKKRSMQYYC